MALGHTGWHLCNTSFARFKRRNLGMLYFIATSRLIEPWGLDGYSIFALSNHSLELAPLLMLDTECKGRIEM